jgi:hypothetical protein
MTFDLSMITNDMIFINKFFFFAISGLSHLFMITANDSTTNRLRHKSTMTAYCRNDSVLMYSMIVTSSNVISCG